MSIRSIGARRRPRLAPGTEPALRPLAPGGARAGRWLSLFLTARSIATGVAVALLAVHHVTDHDRLLIVLALVYGIGSSAAAARWAALHQFWAAWLLDALVTLGLVLASEEWRSPFYLLALTSIVLPATALPYRRAIGFGVAFTLLYLLVATMSGIDWGALDTTARFESFSTHLLVPILITFALAHASGLLRRLKEEQELSERLAIEAERRRLASDLHDSAKQRVHAAHLILSSAASRLTDEALKSAVGQAVAELQAATADMDVNLADLRTPLDGTSLEPALRERAAELERASALSTITVRVDVPELPVTLTSHVFRIASEAMTNAVRHADAKRIDVQLTGENGLITLVVADDGKGLPPGPLSGSNGMRSMRARAEALGGLLSLSRGGGGRGTVVRLEAPRPEDGRKP